jgi:hypothetical protein
MADIQVANTDADLTDNTLITEENAYTITGLHTYSRSTSAPFAVNSGAAVVANLDADKLDGQEGSYYLAAGNATGTLAVGNGGTGATSLTDGGVLLGSGTSAVTAMAVLADGEMIVGDGSTDPVAESGATLRTSIGVGTGDSPQFTAIELGAASDTTIARASAGNVTIEGNAIYRAGGTDVAVADGGTGASSLTDGGVLLGSGTSAVTAMAVLSDGEMIVGDGSTDPVAESGATLRTSIGVGTGDSPQFTGLSISGTGASALDVGGGINAGTGNVSLVGTDGKLEGPLSSTIIDDLSGANLTTLNASNLSSGTVATARLGSGTASSTTFLRGDSSWATALTSNQAATVLSKTGDYTVTTGDAGVDAVIKCDPAGGAFTITLFAASGNTGRRIQVVKTTSNTNAVTVDGNGSETLSGETSIKLYVQYDYVTLVCDGSNWFIEDERITMYYKATLSASQSIGTGSWTKIVLDSVTTDTAGAHASNCFTAPRAGYYLAQGHAFLDNYNGAVGAVGVWKNGDWTGGTSSYDSGGGYTSGPAGTIEHLASGNTIQLFVYQTRGSSINVTSALQNCSLRVWYLHM